MVAACYTSWKVIRYSRFANHNLAVTQLLLFRYALEQILGDLSADDRIARIQQHLEGIRDGFQNGTIDIALLEIAKQLTKNPENYPDAKNLSHVLVALRANSRGGKKLVQGDTVSFIICLVMGPSSIIAKNT